MALTVQNLRAVGVGVEPASLLPGQIAFNITDKVIYVGDGSGFKTNFEGDQVPGVPGEGWYSMPMDFDSLGDYFVANPQIYGDTPTNLQVLTWSTAAGHPIWTTGGGGGGGGNQVYVTTNAAVAAAPGLTTSAKISAAIGVVSPDEGDTAIVTGLPDDVYEGLYFFTTVWVKGAAYAYPSASEVIYNNTGHPTLGANVQTAIDDLDDGLASTTAIANTANSTATSALSIASAALPRAGGIMTGELTAQNIDVQSGYFIKFNGGGDGSLYGISNSTSITSSVIAASATAVKDAYDLANAAVPRSSFNQSGSLLVGTGPGTFTALNAGPANYILASTGTGSLQWVLQSEGDVTSVNGAAPIFVNNTDPQNPVVNITGATVTAPGAVQLNDTLSSTSTTQALTAKQGKTLQDQINSLTAASNVDLGGSIDCSTGLITSVTAAGTAALLVIGSPLPAPAPGNVDVYVIVTVGDSSFSPTGGGGPYSPENGDWFLSNGTQWQYLGVGARPSYASETVAGIIQLAYPADVQAGLNGTLAVTPATLQSKMSNSTSITSSTTIASSTAVKAAYDLADAALPLSGDTMTGTITFAAGQTFPVSGIQGASTTQVGVVQLNDTTSSTSTTQALTANQGKNLQDQINALSVSNNLTLAGTIDGNTGFMLTVTTEGTAKGFVSGSPMPAPVAGNAEYFTIVTVPGTMTAPGGSPQIVNDGDWWLSNGTAWQYLNVGYSAPYATTTSTGVVQLATDAQTQAGTNTTSVVVPSSLQSKISDSTSTTSSTTIASSTAVKAAYDLADAALPDLTFTAKGDMVVGTGPATYSVVGVGAAGQVLLADPLTVTGVTWGEACYVPDTVFTAAGQIVVGTGLNTYAALPVGTNGQLLVADSACAEGVKWGGIALCAYTCTATPFNTALGANAGDSVSSGTDNTTLGYNAGTAITTGSNNTFVGSNTGDGLSTGTNNTAVGACAFSSTGNSNNTVVGFSAGASLTTGSSNTFVGSNAGDLITGANSIVAIGQGSMGAAATGAGTVAVGAGALAVLTSGTGNVAVGNQAGDSVTTGSDNTIIGHQAGISMSSATSNTLLGKSAGSAITVGGTNILLGANAGDLISTGSNNTVIGSVSGSSALTGNLILAAGTTTKFQANDAGAWSYNGTDFGTSGQVLASRGSAATPIWCTLSLACVPCAAFTTKGDILAGTGSSTFTALPVGTNGQVLVPNSTCASGLEWITVGALCLQGYTCAAAPFNTALGGLAGDSITSGTNNTVLGYNAGTGITTGSFNVLLGSGSGSGVSIHDGHVGIGYQTFIGALDINNSNLVAIGTCALRAVTTGQNNLAIGFRAGLTITGGGCNIAIGACALDSVTTSANNIGIGFCSLTSITSGSENMGIGTLAGAAVTTGVNNYSIGYLAGCAVSTGTDNTFLGDQAGRNTTGSFNVFLGGIAGCGVTSGTCSVGIGYDALNSTFTGTQVVAIGRSAGTNLTTGSCSTFVGHNAGAGSTTSCNTAIGWCALATNTTGSFNTVVGVGAAQQGATPASLVAIGHTAAQSVNNTGTVAIGRAALQNATTGVNTAVGYFALQQHITAGSSTAVGFQAGCAATGGGHTLVGNNSGCAITTGTNNTIVGPYVGTPVLANNVVLADGSANIRFQANSTGAVSFDGTNFGTSGQLLQSNGTGAAPTWVTSWQTATSTLTTTSTTTLLSLPVATTRSVQLFLTASNTTTGRYNSDTYQIITDGTTANSQLTGGASLGAGNAYTWSVAVSGGNLLLQVTPNDASSTKFIAQYFVTPV